MSASFFDGLGRMFWGQAIVWSLLYFGWIPLTVNTGASALFAWGFGFGCLLLANAKDGNGRNN